MLTTILGAFALLSIGAIVGLAFGGSGKAELRGKVAHLEFEQELYREGIKRLTDDNNKLRNPKQRKAGTVIVERIIPGMGVETAQTIEYTGTHWLECNGKVTIFDNDKEVGAVSNWRSVRFEPAEEKEEARTPERLIQGLQWNMTAAEMALNELATMVKSPEPQKS